ncbi:MAG TPA: ABC transporter ATP-binding protein [Fluviicoccus sp.]|nr:ABC transporter ATP-binding protein [Fluviicoccus sp.]
MNNPRYPLLRCLALYRHMPWRFTLTAALFTVVNLSLSGQQWLIGKAVNDVAHGVAVVRTADGSLDYTVALHWLAILFGVALARGLLQYAAGLMALIIGQDLLFILRERILTQVQRLDLSYHWQHGVGGMITRTTRDADKLRDALINFWRQVFETGMVVVAAVGILCWYNPWLGLVPLLFTLAGMTIFVRETDQLVTLDRAVGAAYDGVNQNLSEGVNGVRVIKAFALEPSRIESFNGQVGEFAAHSRTALAYAASHIPLPQIVIALGHVWVLAWGAHLVGQGKLNIGELVAAVLMANTLILRIEGIGRVMQVFADARSSAARLWELLDAEPAIVSGTETVPEAPLGVRLTGVSVAAPGGGKDVLHDLSLQVNPGEIVALVGTTGSGKSTLMGLLPRLVEARRGEVAIGSDSLGWRDVRRLDSSDLRRHVHVVTQESFLFSDTLAANLRQAKPDATREELHEALRLAAADEVLERLDHGFETRLGDRGVTLSGGQRQRICLARALLAKASILGLDDATSALDANTEKTILDNIRRFREHQGRTVSVLIVSSKLSTILLADRVLLLADGHIVAQGTHAELAANNTAYRELMGL